MSKPIYRARMTLKSGAYRTREFGSPKNAITHAKQLANEGARGYVERVTSGNVDVIFNTEEHVEVA